jgi:hypothetical protein
MEILIDTETYPGNTMEILIDTETYAGNQDMFLYL